MPRISCTAIKCLWNDKEECFKEVIAIGQKFIYKYDQIVEIIPNCVSYSSRESVGHFDPSKFPQR